MRKKILTLLAVVGLLLCLISCELNIVFGELPTVTEPPLTTLAPSVTEPPENPKSGVVVMLDAGHGDIDPGTLATYSGTTYLEKNINLSVCLFLRDELISRGYTVELIREDDTSLLHGRDNIAEAVARRSMGKDVGADLYLSLHCNSFAGSARAYGPIVFYRGVGDYSPTEMANEIKETVTDTMKAFPDTRACRVTRDDDYAVLKVDTMPSFIIEMGFMTDDNDLRLLIDEEWQKAMAMALADSVDSLYEKKYIGSE
jgi:N-acetylmuramoyl-L-alanine amidase